MSSNAPLLSTLTKGARAAFPYISALVNTTMTPSQIVQAAKDAGFSFRTQSGYDIIAALRDNQSTPQYLRSIDNNTIPNSNNIGTTISRQLRNYSYKVVVRGLNSEGATVNRNITVSSNQLLTKNQITEIASTIAATTTEGSDVSDISSVDVVDATKQVGI